MFGQMAQQTHPQALTGHAFSPAAYLTLDLETGDAPQEAIAAAIDAWTPPGNIKDPTRIDARREEATAKIRERAALLDASPLLCIAVQTDRVNLIFNGMDDKAYKIDGWQVIACGDERGMLMAFREWADRSTNGETVVAGHNHLGFDLPKLRAAYVRHLLRLPRILTPNVGADVKQPTVDTMKLFKAFSMEHRDDFLISLDVVASSLSIPRPKQVICGAEIPRLHRGGRFEAILIYCAVDCTTTARAFQLMTSTATDLE